MYIAHVDHRTSERAGEEEDYLQFFFVLRMAFYKPRLANEMSLTIEIKVDLHSLKGFL